MEAIIDFILDIFSCILSIKYGKEILVFIISLLPILELRGGLLAAAMLNIDPLISYIICIIGNVIPIPFILLFIKKVLDWMSICKIKWIKKIVKWLNKKVDKNKKTIEKYGYLGLVLFVGIPLPGTGAWTGCLMAEVLEMNRKKSFVCIMIGVIMASIIMMLISFGIFKNLLG